MTGSGWRLAREATGKTLRALAAEVGISPPFLSDVEHGRRRFSPETEDRIRAALRMPPREEQDAPRCVVCEGPLRDETHSVYYGDPMHMIIGPGHANQLTPVRHIWCPRCGLEYRHPPRPAAPEGDDRDR